jgi:hypothetical protein
MRNRISQVFKDALRKGDCRFISRSKVISVHMISKNKCETSRGHVGSAIPRPYPSPDYMKMD